MIATPRPVVLVTGAARRLGRAMALDLARHGFDVAVHYRASAADAQATGQLDDRAALDRRAERVECLEQLRGQHARPGAELPQLARRARLQGLRELARQRVSEQRRQFRRGDEIAARLRHQPELAARVRVVAQARRIQRQGHEAVERQPTPGARDGRLHQCCEPRWGGRYTGGL